MPQGYTEDGHRLGTWVSQQRKASDKMLPERKQRLDAIGFVWDAINLPWEEGFAALLKFRLREGHCRVHQHHTEGGLRLGAWVNRQRLVSDTMPPERKQRLDDIGFVWDPLSLTWEKGFTLLLNFKTREGHCRVTGKHNESGFRLGRWVQRQRKAAEAMAPERKNRLDAIGFVWLV